MRWFALIFICGAVTTTFAEPEPKKYQTEIKHDKKSNLSLAEPKLNEKYKDSSDKKTNNDQNTSLSEEERKFLRDVEEKFGVKSSFPTINSENVTQDNSTAGELPFPAVIAIEIVNETNSKTKDKRTIDANLGFGYRTNTGYSYTYFGKPKDKSKFMIYPYSQQDIPPLGKDYQNNAQSPSSTIVEIKPSQAYELLPLKEEHSTYKHNSPVIGIKNNYDNFKGYDYTRPSYPENQYYQNTSPLSTFYTTYNGKQFSGFTKQFPTVASNYFVDPSQLLNNPQYQSAGLTQAHLNPHNSQMEYRVVPVLVLKVPSTYLKDPSAELYSDMPNNYLNNIDLQQLVHDYFKKIGYAHGPQLMAFQNPPASTGLTSFPSADYQSQRYSAPYVVPTYTQSHVSGVQYSGVNPVMAKYPKAYNQQDYYTPNPQSQFYQPGQQQQDYQYQYVPRSSAQVQQLFYQQKLLEDSFPSTEPSITTQIEQHGGINYSGNENANQLKNVVSTSSPIEYGSSQIQNDSKNLLTSGLTNDLSKGQYSTLPTEYTAAGNTGEKTEYWPPKSENNLYSDKESAQHDSKSALSSYTNQDSQGRNYVNQPSDSDSLVISENYPSKDHTIATILPYQYKPNTGAAAVQSVSYVTPVPSNFQSRYNVMVQQTVFKPPTEENVSYVHSQSLPHYARGGSSNTDYNSESEYTLGPHIVPPVGTQRPAPFPRNYHTYQKRMTRLHKHQSATLSRLVTSSERTLR